jgi:tRNA(Ile)-lysidine synthase
MSPELEIPWLSSASARKKWLVGVSGGLDSMALLHLLDGAGFRNLVVCHLDHGLRGRESAEDAGFVKNTAEKMGFEVESAKVDLKRLMGESGESLETAGRRARHEFFADGSKKHRCKRLLLGHHADDQAETVLWNLMRGSHGCRGMSEVSVMEMGGVEMEVFRPLLSLRKDELRAWMEVRKFKWREDASNRVNDVVRNRIRNEALPLLADISMRDVVPMFARAVKDDEAQEELVDWAISQVNVLDPQGRLHLGVLRSFPEVLRTRALLDFLRSKDVPGISAALVGRCLGLLDTSSPASVNLPGGARLRRRAGRVFLEEN